MFMQRKNLTEGRFICYEEEEPYSAEELSIMRAHESFRASFGAAALMAYSESEGLVHELREEHV